MKQCLFSAFQAHVERMEKEATLSEEIPAKRERKHSSNTSNPDTVDVKNGHSTREVGKQFLICVCANAHILDMLMLRNRGGTVSRRSPIEGVRPTYATLCS